jgi:hypothetical protein
MHTQLSAKAINILLLAPNIVENVIATMHSE